MIGKVVLVSEEEIETISNTFNDIVHYKFVPWVEIHGTCHSINNMCILIDAMNGLPVFGLIQNIYFSPNMCPFALALCSVFNTIGFGDHFQ